MKPKRIQRRRTKGWTMPPNTVYVGRPSKWGNPMKVSQVPLGHGDEQHRRISAVEWFRYWLRHTPAGRALREAARRELRGKDLACWCPLQDENGRRVPCHADVLLEVANLQKEKK